MNNNNYFIFIILVLILISIIYFNKCHQYENYANHNLVDIYAVRKNENCEKMDIKKNHN